MSPDTVTWIWLFAGILLIVTEFFLPGLVVCFVGLAAMAVAGFRWMGFFQGWVESFTAWFVTSIVFLLALRQLALRWIPAERTIQSTDEDVEAIGMIVEVVHQISSTDQNGRIRFGGTSWPATTREGVIETGRKAKLILRDNLVWIVEPAPELEEPGKN